MTQAAAQQGVYLFSSTLPSQARLSDESTKPSVVSRPVTPKQGRPWLEAACTITSICFAAATLLAVSTVMVRIVLDAMMQYSGFGLLRGIAGM